MQDQLRTYMYIATVANYDHIIINNYTDSLLELAAKVHLTYTLMVAIAI